MHINFIQNKYTTKKLKIAHQFIHSTKMFTGNIRIVAWLIISLRKHEEWKWYSLE